MGGVWKEGLVFSLVFEGFPDLDVHGSCFSVILTSFFVHFYCQDFDVGSKK